ncbi:MAG: hypothetical protein A2Y40_00025 [Candidatus Margulisbacteria bacterium GWF2_35_9]|nr:MAG: hypothetical protein A2Y40_00025 [Candidatus Margulisbacteria bacterium GWF2_35_9]
MISLISFAFLSSTLIIYNKMIKKILIISFLLFSFIFPLDIWITIDKSQQDNVVPIFKKFFPNSNLSIFYWEDALPKMISKIKRQDLPDIILTGHTYVPFIATHYSKFSRVDPLFWDIRALYVWGNKEYMPINNWSEIINYIQSHTNFISFPTKWDPNSFYNYLSFFNDQLPFWISQTPFTVQNMLYTTNLLATLKRGYPSVFRDNPTKSFLSQETSSIIAGLWMYNILKFRQEQFTVYPVPKSQNGIAEFKGAYVGILFNDTSDTLKALELLNSYDFQQKIWIPLNLLPSNKKLQSTLKADPVLTKLIEISNSSRWATSIEPDILTNRIEVLNYLLQKPDLLKNFNEKKLRKFFNNKLYFNIMKLIK